MSKKKNKTDTTLKRAETLFNTGNFLLAEIEFEKIEKRVNSKEITQKLEICRRETRVIKGKEFIKQGHKAITTNNLTDAIACFQEAQKLLNEAGLGEKIRELQDRVAFDRVDAIAFESEASHDYLRAGELYTQAWEKTHHLNFLLKSALCLVKAEEYGRALPLFQQLYLQQPDLQPSDILDDQAQYAHGFALAKSGKYYDALKQWERLESSDKDLLEQKRLVLSLAWAELDQALEQATDITQLHSRANSLLAMAHGLDMMELISPLEKISSHCRLVLIETLWKEGKFSSIADLLVSMPVLENEPMVLALNAKTYFHLSQDQASFLEPMMAFWLTALYSPEVSALFSDIPGNRQKVQDQLIWMAEQLINSHPYSPELHRASQYLAIEKKLLKDLLAISQKQERGFSHICTPRHARLTGVCPSILELIRHSRDYFTDPEHYLETGGYYSRAGEALYALRTNGVKKAYAQMETIIIPVPGDEFTDYVRMVVQFEAGLVALENDEKELLSYFALTPQLFEAAPSIEKRFLDKILESDREQLSAHEKILTFLHKERGSDSLAESLSTVMVRSAIMKYNRRSINDKLLKNLLEKALKLYPENELALHNLEKACIDLECEAVCDAILKHKLSKAARMAGESAYPEVAEAYFELVEKLIAQLDLSDLDNSLKKIELSLFLNGCLEVDPDHWVTDLIQKKLLFLGDER